MNILAIETVMEAKNTYPSGERDGRISELLQLPTDALRRDARGVHYLRYIRTMEHGNQSMTIRSLDALALCYELSVEEVIIRAKRLRESSL